MEQDPMEDSIKFWHAIWCQPSLTSKSLANKTADYKGLSYTQNIKKLVGILQILLQQENM